MNYKALPKIELHCHLDGSLRPGTIIDLAKHQGVDLGTCTEEQIRGRMIAPMDCQDLNEYLERFDLPILMMQTKESLERTTYELMEDGAKENVKYIEIRFAPTHHTKKGLTYEEIIESVIKGMKRGEKDFDIKGNIIISILRFLPPEMAHEVIEASKGFLGKGVVAVDLAANEDPGFCHHYVDAFRKAREYGFNITIHAGEQGVGQNVLDAVELLGATRIGHGVHILNHQEAYERVKKQKVVIESCPTSNVQTKAVDSFEEHPFYAFLQDGILMSINTDNRTVSDTTMEDEVKRIDHTFSLTDAQYTKIYHDSIQGSFADDEVKEYLKSLLPIA